MNRLGLCLLLALTVSPAYADNYGDGVRFLHAKAYPKAAAAFRAAAAEGNPAAERQLGFMHYKGTGFKQNDHEAVAWFERAAIHGDLESQVNLGQMYENGLSVAQSDVRSAHWFRMAAEQGHRGSQFRFGEICYLGTGVPHDYAEAVKWWHLAMLVEDDLTTRMRSMLQTVTNKIPSEAQEEGRGRAEEWLAVRARRK